MSRRLSEPRRPSTMCFRERPLSLGPCPPQKSLVETTTSERRHPRSRIACPMISSARPFAYTSALSKKFTPASRHAWSSAFASFTSSWLPNVTHAPYDSWLTRSPDLPRFLYCIFAAFASAAAAAFFLVDGEVGLDLQRERDREGLGVARMRCVFSALLLPASRTC
ncbi:Os02g0817400 [Oryza sativa Japonica Group]|uniref:Uncharacterized protein n=2 Tax=Oryza sativa subsp. japonica TaxID=39947 RepID=A0A0N7KGB9_ORYSJ|nr:unknown protein [Oryza sativa Japonica Group]BAD22022.1 unknown protein [Oryza sativa Japonica Group]BAS81585.1 Os02g0817400 [Oryza sativa Japonica Group]